MTLDRFAFFPNSPFDLYRPYMPSGDQPIAINKLVHGLENGLLKQVLKGVTGSGKTYTMANIIARFGKPTLILAPNKTLAAQIYSEMREFFPKNAVEYFVSYYDYYQPEAYIPKRDFFIEKDASINSHIEQMRLSATKSLLERRDTIIISTVSCIYAIGNPKDYLEMILVLRRGDYISRDKVIERLISMQYKRNNVKFSRGIFRIRGEVIDIFPAEHSERALRLKLIDEKIESIKIFDPLTSDIYQELTRFTVYPNSHHVIPYNKIVQAVESIKKELDEQTKILTEKGCHNEAQRLIQRTNFDIEMLQELGSCKGIENYSRHFSGIASGDPPPTLIDFLPIDSIMFIDESHITIGQINAMARSDYSRKEVLVRYGFRLPSALDNRPLHMKEFETRMRQCIFVSATPSNYEISCSDNIVEQIVRPTGLLDPIVEIRPASTQIDDLLGQILKHIRLKGRVLVITLTKRMSENLTNFLMGNGIKVRYLHSDIDTIERGEILRDLRLGTFDVLIGINLLREGLDIPEVSLVAILDADKEGFLRSSRSLIQIIGRAARNLNGYAILYGDNITNSMKFAIDETERRRAKQIEFNNKNNIIARGIYKTIHELIDGVMITPKKNKSSNKKLALSIKSEKSLSNEILRLEKKMMKHAHNLEFLQAANVRDSIIILKNRMNLSGKDNKNDF